MTRFGVLAAITMVIGTLLCAIVGGIGQAVLDALPPAIAPAALIILVIAAIALAGWTFCKLVAHIYRKTY
jgi:hypothetical protein